MGTVVPALVIIANKLFSEIEISIVTVVIVDHTFRFYLQDSISRQQVYLGIPLLPLR